MKNIKKPEALTPREMEIVLLFTRDFSRKMIAADLNISIRTVDTHLKSIHLKTKTHSIAGIVSYGFKYLKAAG